MPLLDFSVVILPPFYRRYSRKMLRQLAGNLGQSHSSTAAVCCQLGALTTAKLLRQHAEPLRLAAEEYKKQGFTVTAERQNDFRLTLVATKHEEAVIVAAKVAQPNQSHEVQVMLYMLMLPLADQRYRYINLRGRVYYHDHSMDVPRGRRPLLQGGNHRAHRPSGIQNASEEDTQCWRVPVLSDKQSYCPERVEQ